MDLMRIVDLPSTTEKAKIYERIRQGTMKCYEDESGYMMFDKNELKSYKPRKSGRPRKEI
jgi:hypothetical protein